MDDLQRLIAQLAPFVTDKRQARIKSMLDHRLSSIHLAMECPSDINNALAAVRTSEALGIDTIHIIHPQGSAKFVGTATQGAIFWVNLVYHKSFDDFLTHLKSHNTQIILAGAKADGDVELNTLPITQPICLLLGNERRGLSETAIKNCNLTYRIPMCGVTESLNLSVSAAISLYDITQRKRALLNSTGDLSATEYSARLAKAYLRSVPKRLAKAVLNC